MNFFDGEIYHVFNRGNQQQKIFFHRENYLFFLKKLRIELLPYCDMLAYCLMPNHFHLLLQATASRDNLNPPGINELNEQNSGRTTKSRLTTIQSAEPIIHPLARKIGTLQSSYTRAIQNQENFKGSLFQQKTKSVVIKTEAQIQVCTNYIHQNPMKAILVARMEDWEFSSFKDYCGLRKGTICNQPVLRSLIGISQRVDFYNLSYATLLDCDVELIYKKVS